jgi:mannose-6-phosphate isomerase
MHSLLNKKACKNGGCGESWELSGVEGHVSIISNGFLAGNDLQELIEVYMGDLVGERVYEMFGHEFPLLIKFIDAIDDLSIQVHPGDELAKTRHNAFGKTEMWYVLHADEDAKLNSGFNQPVTREKFIEYLHSGRLTELLSFENVEADDVYFIPAGRVHAIGRGIIVAEIQQTSDVTYRIFDYNRQDKNGEMRELHTELALDAIDFSFQHDYKTRYKTVKNKTSEVVTCKYFTTNIIEFDDIIKKDISHIDSFVIYICVDGEFSIHWKKGNENIIKGETLLVPACLEEYELVPKNGIAKVLEVHIP